MADIWTDFINLLLGAYGNPFVFLPMVFLYAIAIAVILPIPIELSLVAPILNQDWGYLAGIALALAAGKTVGAWLIFVFGVKVEDNIRWWSQKWRFAKWVVGKDDLFVQKKGYLGLDVLLTIPLLSGTPSESPRLSGFDGRAQPAERDFPDWWATGDRGFLLA